MIQLGNWVTADLVAMWEPCCDHTCSSHWASSHRALTRPGPQRPGKSMNSCGPAALAAQLKPRDRSDHGGGCLLYRDVYIGKTPSGSINCTLYR